MAGGLHLSPDMHVRVRPNDRELRVITSPELLYPTVRLGDWILSWTLPREDNGIRLFRNAGVYLEVAINTVKIWPLGKVAFAVLRMTRAVYIE